MNIIETAELEDRLTEADEQSLEEPKLPNLIDRVPRDVDSPFKNSIGNYYLRSLFHETKAMGKKGLYTLKDKDHTYEGIIYKSLYILYMEEGDLTEYFFATKYLDSWVQWQALIERPWFKEHVQRWRTELELRLKAEALQRILLEAKEGGKNQYNANRFIVEKGYIDKTAEPSRRGRPTKAEISRRAAEEAFSDLQVQEAAKRLEIN